jgi:hypothetical protein
LRLFLIVEIRRLAAAAHRELAVAVSYARDVG